jgi:hypothetical protein
MEFDTKTIIKWAAIGIGAYLVYRYLVDNGYIGGAATTTTQATTTPLTQGQIEAITAGQIAEANKNLVKSGSAVATTTPATPGYQTVWGSGGASATTTPASSSVVTMPTTKDLVAQLASGDSYMADGRMGIDRWNHYYNQTPAGKSRPAPDPSTMVSDRNAPISVDEWWSLMAQAGLSGMLPISAWNNRPWSGHGSDSRWRN